MDILLLGDTHQDLEWTNAVIRFAQDINISTIVQLGDFGYWEENEDGKRFLDEVSRCLIKNNIKLYWLDGNHENHPLLRKTYSHQKSTFWKIRDNLLYIPRGTAWEWGGIKFLAVGGGASIDRDFRINGISWFPEEILNEREIEKAKAAGKVDVFLSHDGPLWPFAYKGSDDIESSIHHQKIKDIINTVQPKMCVHGHFHNFYDINMLTSTGHTRVVGLTAEQRSKAFAVLELPSLQLFFPT